jgi:hypothetical protein
MSLSRELRGAFEDLVRQIAETGYVPDAVFRRGDRRGIETIGEFLARFVGCDQRLSASSRASIEGLYFRCFGNAPSASRFATYARAARRIAEVRREVSGLVS